MKNPAILIFFLFFCSIQIQAQRDQTIYAEIFGAGIRYSINYDTRFSKIDGKFGGRIGIEVLKKNVFIPLQLNYLIGKGSHKLELGAGILTVLENEKNYKQTSILPSGAIMYRFMKEGGHFLFRAGLSPTFDNPNTGFTALLWIWPGASVGYKF